MKILKTLRMGLYPKTLERMLKKKVPQFGKNVTGNLGHEDPREKSKRR